jgi:SnoaL-like domain
MAIQDRYLEYAEAFEKSYLDDDWSRIEPYFTDGAVYEGEPLARGRPAVLARLKNGVANFDRRMDSRTLTFEKPTVKGNAVTVRWKAKYTKKGLPDLTISGAEIATFDGNRIASLRDDFDPHAQKAMGDWMEKHGKALQT